MGEEIRKTGIDVVGDVPWGTHLCQFYQTKKDLIDILVPYFKAGLESNEFCMWVTSKPLIEEEAKKAMRKAVPEFDQYLKRGQIEIIPHTDWYLKDGAFNLKRVLNAWIDKLNQALSKGYDGIRVTGNTAWLEKRDWRNFTDYEEEINNTIDKYPMIAICTYSLDKCGASEVIDVVNNHQFAFIRREGKWEVIESSERRQAEEQIDSLAKFPSENPNPVLRVARDGTILYANEASSSLLNIWGCKIGQPLPDEWRKFSLDVLGSSLSRDVEVECGDRIFSLTFAPLVDADHVNIYGLDITERKQAEEDIKNLAKFPSENPYPVLRVARDGTILYANAASTSLLSEWSSGIDQLVPDDWRQLVADVLDSNLRKRIEVEHRDRIFSFVVVPVTNAAYVNLYGRDITERKKAEERLSDTKQMLENIAQGITEGILLLSKDFKILWANKAFLDQSGYKMEEILGNYCYKVTHRLEGPCQPPHDPCPIYETKKTGKPLTMVHSHFDKKGNEFFVEVSAYPIMDEKGEIIQFVHLGRDITERKRAEEALRKAHDELERRVEERTTELRLLSSQLLTVQEKERKRVAQELHDSIGQSLTAIKYGVENALRRTGKNTATPGVESLETIVPLIQETIEEVRKIQMDLRPSVLDDLGILATISWFCREFQSIYSGVRIEKQISIQENEVPHPLKTVIFRVLQEAMNNIAKHSKADLVRLCLKKTDGTIELAIEDNGLGFDLKDALAVESSRRGFGLAGMRERTELSGGSFAIQSIRGEGTTIRATWPRQ